MENAKQNKMGTAPIFPLIVSMSLPAMFSMLIQAMYNIVDSIFVARVGDNALTAVSLAFPIQTLIIAVAVGTGVGLNSLISRRLGEQNYEAANSAASHGPFLGICSWLVFAVFGLFFSRTFFEAFTETAQVIEMGTQYISIVTIFSFGSFVQINFEKILQATGNMFYPMLFQLVGAVTNIILDPILIFGYFGFPKMGVAGAAVATVAGQILAMVFSVYVAFRKNHAVTIQIKGFRPQKAVIQEIYAVGLPSIVMQSIGSVLVMGLNAILITFSEIAVSVLGVYYKLQSFVFMPVFGLNQGLMPIMGFNYGAGNKKRLLDALKIGVLIAATILLVGMLLFLFFPAQLLGIFNDSAEMLRIGVPALRIISTSFVFAAVSIIFSTLFQAIGRGVNSLLISVLRQLFVILPVAYLMANLFGLEMVWYAFPIAEVVSVAVSILLFIRVYKARLANLA